MASKGVLAALEVFVDVKGRIVLELSECYLDELRTELDKLPDFEHSPEMIEFMQFVQIKLRELSKEITDRAGVMP